MGLASFAGAMGGIADRIRADRLQVADRIRADRLQKEAEERDLWEKHLQSVQHIADSVKGIDPLLSAAIMQTESGRYTDRKGKALSFDASKWLEAYQGLLAQREELRQQYSALSGMKGEGQTTGPPSATQQNQQQVQQRAQAPQRLGMVRGLPMAIPPGPPQAPQAATQPQQPQQRPLIESVRENVYGLGPSPQILPSPAEQADAAAARTVAGQLAIARATATDAERYVVPFQAPYLPVPEGSLPPGSVTSPPMSADMAKLWSSTLGHKEDIDSVLKSMATDALLEDQAQRLGVDVGSLPPEARIMTFQALGVIDEPKSNVQLVGSGKESGIYLYDKDTGSFKTLLAPSDKALDLGSEQLDAYIRAKKTHNEDLIPPEARGRVALEIQRRDIPLYSPKQEQFMLDHDNLQMWLKQVRKDIAAVKQASWLSPSQKAIASYRLQQRTKSIAGVFSKGPFAETGRLAEGDIDRALGAMPGTFTTLFLKDYDLEKLQVVDDILAKGIANVEDMARGSYVPLGGDARSAGPPGSSGGLPTGLTEEDIQGIMSETGASRAEIIREYKQVNGIK